MVVTPSGALRFYARIENDSGTTRNAVGEVVESWAEYATAWMNIVKLSGAELVTAQQIKTNSTHQVTMRYQDGIAADMRIKWNPTIASTATLHIVDVNNVDNGNHTLLILAKEDA
jgi:SPP1 family predicted phage head-tail adaptor